MQGISPNVSNNERKELLLKVQAKAELERRYKEERILFYKPCSFKHADFHKSIKTARFFFGGNRSGKSVSGIAELVFKACLKKHPFTGEVNPRIGRYRIFTTEGKLIYTHIIPLIKEWFPTKWYRGGSFKTAFDSRHSILNGANGTVVDILTYEQDVAVTESVALDGVWADEEMPYSFFSSTMARLISTNGSLWITVTPLAKLSWALDYWNKGNDPKIDVFKVSIFDNPHLDPKSRDEIIQMWPEHERDARVKGEFLEFKGLVFKELDRNVHLVEHTDRMESGFPIIMALDPHQRKPSAITWSYLNKDELVFFDELEIEGNVDTVVKAIKQKEAAHSGSTQLRVIDPAAKKQISGFGSQFDTLREFQDAGMQFTLAYNDIEAGLSAMKQKLYYNREQPISALNRPTCYFTTNVPKTWEGMTNLMWDDWLHSTKLRDVKEKIKDFKKDFPDCVRYTIAIKPNRQSHVPVTLKFGTKKHANTHEDLTQHLFAKDTTNR